MATFDWANASVAKVLDLYIAWFNRVPDVAGMASWIARLQAGESLESVSTQFLAAAYQYTDQTGYTAAMSDHQFIVKLYEGVLGRTGSLAPNAEETSYWVRALNNDLGGNRGEMVLRMLAEAKAFDAQGRPEIQAVIDTLNNKTLVSKYALDQGVSYASAELSIIQGKAFLDGVDGTANSALEAKTEVDLHQSPATERAFTVAQVEANAHGGGAYHLLDTLKNIAAADAIRAGAIDFKITNWPGSVGAATIHEAEVLQLASNGGQYDYSLADTVAKLVPASPSAGLTDLIRNADSVAVLGTETGDTIDLNGYVRGAILNGFGGNDMLTGTTFNDVYYGGSGTNTYSTRGGTDTFHLSADGTDLIFLTGQGTGGLANTGPMHIYGMGPGDKFILSNADFSTNLEGSWTKDDVNWIGPHWRSGGSVNTYDLSDFNGQPAHTVGLYSVDGQPGFRAATGASDGANFFEQLMTYNTNATGIAFGVKWKGLIALNDSAAKETYLYYIDTGADTVATVPEINLVAIVHDGYLSSSSTAPLSPYTAFMV